MKANVQPLKPQGTSKRSQQPDGPVLHPNSPNRQIEKYGWPETITLNAPPAGVALFFGAQQIGGAIPIYLVNATGAPLSTAFASDAGFIDFDETDKDTLPHVQALGTLEDCKGICLDSYILDLAGDFLISYTVLATTEQGTRYCGSAPVLSPPRDGWIPIQDWAPIPA